MLGYRFDRFEGFVPEDFAAFEQRKWTSNRFNLERMKARARLDALGLALGELLAGAREGLEFRTTLDHPHLFNRNAVQCCRLYLDRADAERQELLRIVDQELPLRDKVGDPVPEHQFAMTGLELDDRGISVYFKLHAHAVLDRRNLLARLDDPSEHQQLAALLARLGISFRLRFGEEAESLPVTADKVTELRQRLDSYPGWLTLDCFYPRDDPGLAGPAFVSAAAGHLVPLLAVWRYVAWSRANDRLKIARVIKEEKKQKARKLAGFEPGDRVIILSGLLAGKSGTVAQVDARGRVKVLVGRVSIDMDPKVLRKA